MLIAINMGEFKDNFFSCLSIFLTEYVKNKTNVTENERTEIAVENETFDFF